MGKNGNQKCRVIRVTEAHERNCFDALPRELRDALNEAKFSWSAAHVFNLKFKKAISTSILVQAIAAWDAKQEQVDAQRVWGRQHTQITAEELGI